MSRGHRLGVALTGHHLPIDATLRLAQIADARGFDVILVDGDEARVPRRPRAPLYDGTAACAGVLARTRRMHAGSIRLPGYTHVVHVARALATLHATSEGRAIGFFGVGSGRHVANLGLPQWTPGQRVAALDESLEMVRALWTGEPVRRHGRFFMLHDVTAPPPIAPPQIVVGAAGPRALRVVERHADVWDANVPPLLEHLAPRREQLKRELETWLWIFARPDASEADAIAAYRRHCPWFPELDSSQYRRCLLFGDPLAWPMRLTEMREELSIDVAILDLIALPEASARRALQACGPAEDRPMA